MMTQHPSRVRIATPSAVAGCIAFSVLLTAGCGSKIYLASTPHLYTVPNAANPFEMVPQPWCSNEVRILYATDRKALQVDLPVDVPVLEAVLSVRNAKQ